MNILQIIPYFSPRMGGLVQAVRNLSDELAERGHRVMILTTDYFEAEQQEVDKRVSVVIHKNWFSRYNFFFSPGMFLWLGRNLMNFDIAHLHGFRTFQSMLVAYWGQKRKVPYVITPHGSVRISDRLLGVKRLYDLFFGNWILRKASCLFAVCPPEVRELQEKIASDEKIQLVYTGLNLDEFEVLPPKGTFRKRLGIPNEVKIVLGLGRIHRIKGFDVLMRSFAQLLETEKDIVLVIVGPDEGFLEELVRLSYELNITDKVIFPGPLYDDNKLAAYHDADVFVLNSSVEAFGTVSFEAIMCRTPVIISDKAGMSEVFLDYDAGFVVNYGDVQALASLIKFVIENNEDVQERVRKGKKITKEMFSWYAVAVRLEKEYHRINNKIADVQ